MITLKNCTFAAKGANNKDKVYGVALKGSEDVKIEGCTFENTGYAAIKNDSTGNVKVKDCTFNTSSVYNPYEGSITNKNGNVSIISSTFDGKPGNNIVNVYNQKDGSQVILDKCTVTCGMANNPIRISNVSNASFAVNVDNCSYSYNDTNESEYTGFICLEDFTSKKGTKQDFTKVSVNINGLTKPENFKQYFYVYEDDKGIITGEGNDPVVYVDGTKLS